jgi:hypothetical protein
VELTFEHAVGIFGFLLLLELGAVLRDFLSSLVEAMHSRGIVSLF